MKEKKQEKKRAGRHKIPMITKDLGDLETKLKPKPILFEEVVYWINLGATAEEIAGSYYVSVSTLVRRLQEEIGMNFDDLKKRCCGSAKLQLRRNQFKMSATNATMAIWLGKNWLGQRDESVLDDIFNPKWAMLLDHIGSQKAFDNSNKK